LALKQRIISESDLFKTDAEVMEQLKAAGNEQIDSLLKRLVPGRDFIYSAKSDAEFYGPNKPRAVDPLVKTAKGLQRLSELLPNYADFKQQFLSDYKYLGVNQKD
jgi:hypothetical protein